MIREEAYQSIKYVFMVVCIHYPVVKKVTN